MKKRFLFSILFGLSLCLPAFAVGEDDATVLYNKGIDLYEQDKVEQSIATFKKAISIAPDFYEAYYNLARIQEASGKTQDAITSYEGLLKIAPNDYESAYQFGELLYKKGYLSKAVSILSTIPTDSEYHSKATTLSNKIKKRQEEIVYESKIKAEQALKATTVGSIVAPSGIVVDNKGDMYVNSFSENKIIKISKDGSEKTVFAEKSNLIDGPIGIAIDSYNNLYVANYNKGNVVLFDKNGNGRVLMYVKKPYCINLDEKNKKIYVTEQQNNTVISYDIGDVLKLSSMVKNEPTLEVKKEQKVITVPIKDDTPIGTPSIIESNFTKTSPTHSITAPIMVPSSSMFDY